MLPNNTHQPDLPISILIVNNNPEALATIDASLQVLAQVTTTCVDSARKALRVLRQQTIDVLIVDVDIPDLDGWRLSRLVRSGILLCRIDLPIVITAQTWCERIAEVTAREYGINGVPFFVIDGRYGVSGAQAPETFTSVLERARDEAKDVTADA